MKTLRKLAILAIIFTVMLGISGLGYAQDSYGVISAEKAASAGGYSYAARSGTTSATAVKAVANAAHFSSRASATTSSQTTGGYSWGKNATKTTEASAPTITEVTAKDQDGKDITVKLTDVAGLTSEWLNKIGYDKTKSKVTVELDADGKVKTLTVSDSAGTKICEYQTSTHLMKFFHTEGDLKGKADYVTSESTRQYTWRYSGYDRTDPGMGKDGHVITQKYNYDTDGKVKSVEYFTWTAGNRKKTDDKQKYSRYMYRVDTYKDGVLDKTTYNNDPRPTFWEPTITGKVITSDDGKEYLFKTTDGKIYKFTAMKDGFDADGDGVSGAEEMSKVDWAAYADKDITISLRGQEIAAENESDYYSEGKKIEGFAVSDVIQTDKGEKIKEGWDEIADKVSTALSKVFVIMGDDKDINKVYDKVYTKLADELKAAGISSEDIQGFADSSMQDKWAAKNPDFSKYTTAKSISAKALEYFNSKTWDTAKAFAAEMISRYEAKAKTQQAGLSAYPAAGKEAENEELNSVGLAYWILGNAYKEAKETSKAKEELNTLINDYGYSLLLGDDGTTWKKLKEEADRLIKEIG